jgi:aryl-alcohol dehydrogenase-like predicted oxidoreductase
MHYKLFGNTGLRVSELCLGTMTFGTEWGWGCDYDISKKIFDAYVNAGGNFLDTANRYTEGTSERWLGEFIASDRDHFVLATKYTLYDRRNDPNFMGNHRKNMIRSVEASLKRLNTDYIDLLWVHAWDFTTPIEEIMRGLDDLVRMGKVHYVGISDTPAWIVAQANTLAACKNWTAFAGLQIEYSLIERTPERELLPMAKASGMAVTPWAPLGAGVLTGKYLQQESGRLAEGSAKRSERNLAIAQEVVHIASELGCSAAQVALNWTRQHRSQLVIPIIGASKVTQIEDNLQCIQVALLPEHIERLNAVSAIELGFPHDFLKRAQDPIYGDMREQIDFAP